MAAFKAKRRCLNIPIPKQEEPPVLILKSTTLEYYSALTERYLGETTLEHFCIEGDNQRSCNLDASILHYCYPFDSILMDGDKILHFMFVDSKKCVDFNRKKYIPWPLARE